MITYVIKLTVCSALLLLVYRLLLQREKMYAFNRAYLLFSILFSLMIPFITFEVQVGGIVPEEILLPLNIPFDAPDPAQAAVTKTTSLTLEQIAITIYLLITTMLLIRFLRNLYRIRRAIAGNKILHYNGAKLILTNRDIPAHTFLSYIFISQEDYDNPATRNILLTHELSHVRQKHSWDVLFIEILLVVCWFNPSLVFYKRSMQLNHELQADDAVIKTHDDIPGYQHLLLDKIEQQFATPLTSPFNYFITKKRLTMMTKSPNNRRIACLQLALLPLFIAALFLFSSRTYAQVKAPEKKKTENTTPIKEPKDTVREIGTIFFEKQYPSGPGISAEELKEFNAILDRSTTGGQKHLSYKFSKEDKIRLKALYSTMSTEQRKGYPALMFSKRPARKSPTAQQLQNWQDPKMYGVWIDGKRVSNDVLANYKPADFALYYVSKLSKNAVNYGKHYVQIDLHTPEDYDRTYKDDELLVFVLKRVPVREAVKEQ
jgi:hypothetical protein